MTAFATIDETVQQGGAGAGNAAGLVAVVLRVVVAQHVLDLVECLPGDVGRILVLHDEPPFLARPRLLQGTRSGQRRPRGEPAPIDERSGVGRVLQDGDDGRHRRRAPPDRAVTVAAGQHQRVIQQGTQGLPGGTLVQEGREHQRDSVLHFLVRVLGHHARRVALQTGGQRQGQVAAFGLVEQVRRPRKVCISISEMVPLRPSSRRPFAVPAL